MATEAPVNGNYAPHHGFGSLEHQQNSYTYGAHSSTPSQVAVAQPPPSTTPAAAGTSSTQQADIPKDEVGWYFVEQYYTTLSRQPEKLYLFYNKRSQFVSGQETDKVNVCVGQRSINDRIKELDFQDCKVRVTNVDSQASDSNIVIQVIGEISNKSQPHEKFTQTFVLATQTNGYFVLNDIFRYLIDEEEEPEAPAAPAEAAVEEVHPIPAAESGYQEPAPTAAEVEPKGLTGSAEPAAVEHDAQQVDREIESKVPAEQMAETVEPKVNGIRATEDVNEAEETPAVITPAPEQPAVEEPAPAAAEEEPEPEPVLAEKPQEPAPTPSPPKQATPQPAPAAKPAAPKTWASLAASANKNIATPATPSSASSNASQPKAAPKPAAAQPTPTPITAAAPQAAPTAPAAQRDSSPAEGSQGEEWTAVASSHNRNQSRQTTNQQEAPMFRGYIKNVHESIDGNELKSQLEAFGELLYFDISRQKVSLHIHYPQIRSPVLTPKSQNCAFVDFKTGDGYNAALNAPLNVSGEELQVVQRYTRPGQQPFPNRGQYQGNRGRGGPNPGGPRPNFQGRGGYQPRGRGGNGAPRGRGSSIAI
jgi:hypothetical protein